MQTYRQFRPTGFDAAGAFLDDRQDWLVLPCSQTRDSGELDKSNFANALEMLGGESETVEVHRFGHWGPGWFEIIIVDPAAPAAAIAEDIESALENYPVLSDEDFSRREWEAYCEGWNSYGYKDFLRHLRDEYLDEYGAAYRFLDDVCTADDLRELFESGVRSGEYYHGDDVSVNLRGFTMTRTELAKWIRCKRAQHNPRIAWRDPAQGNLFGEGGAA